MNWDAIGAIGEIIGALVVVATLMYLVRQIKESSVSNKVSGLAQVISTTQAVHFGIAFDESLSAIFIKATNDPDSLTDVEKFRYEQYWWGILRQIEALYIQQQNELIDFNSYHAWSSRTVNQINSEALLSDLWSNVKDRFNPKFRASIDERLDELIESDI